MSHAAVRFPITVDTESVMDALVVTPRADGKVMLEANLNGSNAGYAASLMGHATFTDNDLDALIAALSQAREQLKLTRRFPEATK